MKLKTNDMVLCGLFTAIIVILAQISIAVKTVNMTMLIFAVSITGVILGSKKAFLSTIVYVLLGAIGVPVFAGFSGGIGILVGSTGGFLLGCPLMAYIIGYVSERYSSYVYILFAMIIGLAFVYLMETFMFAVITKTGVYESLASCVLPFVSGDIMEILIATWIGLAIRKRMDLKLITN